MSASNISSGWPLSSPYFSIPPSFIYFILFNIIYLTALRNSLTWLFIALFLGVNPFWANLIPKKTPALDLPTSLICSTILSIKSVVFYLPMWVISSPLKKHFRITVENTASKGADISQFISSELG